MKNALRFRAAHRAAGIRKAYYADFGRDMKDSFDSQVQLNYILLKIKQLERKTYDAQISASVLAHYSSATPFSATGFSGRHGPAN
jgi:hypothetical protein